MWATALRLLGVSPGLRALLGGRHAGRLPGGARGLHGSPVLGGKNLLKKFASKTKKKFWYEGPSLGSHLTYKPSQLEFLTKSTSKKTRKEDHVRLRALNGLLYKALSDLLCTPEVSQQVYDLNVELSKVSLTADFSACRVYWRTPLPAEQNAHAQATLQRHAAHMRHLLMSQQTLRNVPPIVFVQDKGHAAVAEVDRLLAVADLGPADEEDLGGGDLRELEAPEAPSPHDIPGPAVPSSLCGIDHKALHKQIAEYKRRKEKGREGESESPACPGLETAAELRRAMKRRKKARPRRAEELSPKDYPWELAGGDDPEDGRALPEELALGCERECGQAEPDTEAMRGGGRRTEAAVGGHDGRGL
ncbi:putative ribosome-binding factor A, mitochondrial [Phyllostomus discolor]|uniref:Ribosome-binding factor A, mitochondrial n=1 Tax=Phyllostomus discolor TaxID=89673 RepID=A0A6J2MMH9_9CHIR|nr:putative ribosome-binding factor A, mitochondrial [Phyllostomus discolor]